MNSKFIIAAIIYVISVFLFAVTNPLGLIFMNISAFLMGFSLFEIKYHKEFKSKYFNEEDD